MSETLSYILGKRMWWVGGVSVWGELAAVTPEFVISENTGSGFRLLHAAYPLGGETQTIRYQDLVDIKGNRLPATINRPRVVPINKGNSAAVVQGVETADSFRIARLDANLSASGVAVDLLIIEMGD
jgi:hypothetical protein